MKKKAWTIYTVAAICGLALAIVVGAIASPSGSHPQAVKATRHASDATLARARPDTTLMRAFGRAATRADSLPGSAVSEAQSLGTAPDVDPSVLPGALDIAHARLTASLDNGWRLYGMPSTKGWLCAILVGPNAGGGCFLGFAGDQAALAGRSMDSGSQFVWGFVRDGVTAATATDDGVARPVTIANNGFLYRAAPGDEISSMTFDLSDGSTQTVDFGSWQTLK